MTANTIKDTPSERESARELASNVVINTIGISNTTAYRQKAVFFQRRKFIALLLCG